MKPPPFSYHRPDNADAAVRLLATVDNAKLLAGGQSLMPMMAYRYVLPDHVIDLNRCSDLAGIAQDGDDIVIGAMTRQRDLEQSPLIASSLPLMRDALHWVGHVQTRNRGTIGGSLAHLDPAAELPAVLAAYEARLVVRGPDGEREVQMAEWGLGYMMPNLSAGELLTAVRVPVPQAGHAHAFVEVARRHGDFAQAGAGVVLALDGSRIHRARIALCGVDVAPVRLLEAETLLESATRWDTALLARAAETAREVPGLADVHADETYRKRIGAVVTRRALQRALSA